MSETAHEESKDLSSEYYCPNCQTSVADPLICGDCTAVICRRCGSPLERIDELGIG